MDRVIEKVPTQVANVHPWVNALRHYYDTRNEQSCDHLPHIIEVPCCISCSLSITIPDGMKPSLLPIMAPIPITVVDKCKPTVVAEGINSSNLNENISESEDNNDEEDNNNNDNINNNNNNNNNNIDDNNNNNNIDANNNNIDDHNDVDEEDDDEEDDDDDDYAYPESPLLLASKRKRLIAAAVKRINTLPSVNRDTLSFLSKYQTVSGTPPPNYQRWVSRSQKKAKRHRCASRRYTPDVTYSNEFVGALYIPSHNVLICGYSDNRHLFSDLHGLAKSKKDGSPSVPHMVITKEDAKSIMEYHTMNRMKIKYITQDMFSTNKLHNVPMPQDGTIKRSWNVAHIILPQVMCLNKVNKSNASTHVSAEVLANCQVYSWQQIHSAADLVILVGKFGKEDNNDNIDCHKLLVARMQSMISKSISDDAVKSMYSNIAPIAGRKGYEITRTSGTGGITCPQSHKDLLFVLHENDTLLPNIAGKTCSLLCTVVVI
jgi:hypothetical protein